jgi:hypothetical protein
MRLGRRQARLVLPVHQQPPHLLVGHVAHELLDVDPAIAERTALLVGLGDRGVERDYALEPGGHFDHRHRERRIFAERISGLSGQDGRHVIRVRTGGPHWVSLCPWLG